MKFYFNHWLNFTSCILQFPRLRFHLDIFLTLKLKILVSDISWYIFFELPDLYFVALLLKIHIVGSLFRFWLGLLVAISTFGKYSGTWESGLGFHVQCCRSRESYKIRVSGLGSQVPQLVSRLSVPRSLWDWSRLSRLGFPLESRFGKGL